MKQIFFALLALLLAMTLLVSCGSQGDPANTQQESVSATAEEPSSSGSDTEGATQAPETVQETDTQSETESDTESDTGAVSQKAFRSSGSFCSDTGTHMDLTVSWTAESEDGVHVMLTLTAVLNCYSIDVGARPGMGKIALGDRTDSFSTPAYRQTENQKTSFDMFTRSYELTAGADCRVLPDGSLSLPVRVVWPFNGVYGKKQIGDVTAEAVLTFGGD